MTKMGLLRRSSSQRWVDSGIWRKGWAPVGAQPFPPFCQQNLVIAMGIEERNLLKQSR